MERWHLFLEAQVSYKKMSRWYTMQTQLQTDGTLPVALRGDAELTACGDWGAAGETVHPAEPGRGHAGRQAARWTRITRTQSQVEETIWSCVEWFSDWCKNNACNWFIGSLNIKQCQRHLLKISYTCETCTRQLCADILLGSVNTFLEDQQLLFTLHIFFW